MSQALSPAVVEVFRSHANYIIGFVGILRLIFTLLFIGSIYKTMRFVEKAHHTVHIGFCWFLLFPVIGSMLYILSFPFLSAICLLLALVSVWVILPFFVPNTLTRHFSGHEGYLRGARSIKIIGLWFVICLTLTMLGQYSNMSFTASLFGKAPLGSGQQFSLATYPQGLLAVASLVLAIVYWYKIIAIRVSLKKHHTNLS